MKKFSKGFLSLFSLGLLLVSGCATYHAEPLPAKPDLVALSDLTVPARRLELPGLRPHSFNPAKGLDATTVMALAVVNNPQLKAARLRIGVARAQVFAAGLLPDPQVTGGWSRSALHTGYGIGLNENLQALITRGAVRAAARAHAQAVHLQILWQEWQTAEKAREWFIQARTDAQLRRVLTARRRLLAKCWRLDDQALKHKNATASVVVTDMAMLTKVETQMRQLDVQISNTDQDLDQLLGLKPGVRLKLIGPAKVPALSRRQFQAALAALPHRRADLLALQAGYQSQEQRVREAILAQFPALSAGVHQARSPEEGVQSVGLSVNLTLPLFNRNRGHIAIQRATRAVLRQTYQARLDQTMSQSAKVWDAIQIQQKQLKSLNARLNRLKKTTAPIKREWRQGNLTLDKYAALTTDMLTLQADVIRLKASLTQARSVLQTLLGLPFATH